MAKLDPRLNASLLREGRVIFQQLSQIFGSNSKVDNVYAMRAAQAQAEAEIAKAKVEKPPKLKCALCLANTEMQNPRDAITIAHGNAVCATHL